MGARSSQEPTCVNRSSEMRCKKQTLLPNHGAVLRQHRINIDQARNKLSMSMVQPFDRNGIDNGNPRAETMRLTSTGLSQRLHPWQRPCASLRPKLQRACKPSTRNSKPGNGNVQPFDRNCSNNANPRTEAGALTINIVVNYDGWGQRILKRVRLSQIVFAPPCNSRRI